METNMEVRRATREDIPNLVDANLCIARETENFELNRDTVTMGVTAVFDKEERGFYVVAAKEGQFAGSLMVTFEWSDWRNKNAYWIQSVYVRPEHRRQGVFKALYDYVAADSLANAGALRLYVDHDNEVAQKTYAAVGMEASHYRMYELDYLVKD
jgi:ribosomal protein S18 acetylase RimI-like enzyme